MKPSIFGSFCGFSLLLVGQVCSAFAMPAPFPPQEEPGVVVTTEGYVLHGLWLVPKETIGVVLILPGSGNVGTDGDVSGPLLGSGFRGAPAKLSDQIAKTLALQGIASLRYAKRGFEDPNLLAQQTMPFLTQDARSALETVRNRFPSMKVGIVGHSEGAQIASLIASTTHLDSIFLLSLPSRLIDNTLAYQFVDWPVELVRRKLDTNHDEMLSKNELTSDSTVPLLGAGFTTASALSLDVNHDGQVSIAEELIPSYVQLLANVFQLVESPQFFGWYHSQKDLPLFSSYAGNVKAPVFLYHGIEDAQVRWSDAATDQHYFGGPTTLRLFPGLGHCFAPMEGIYGEIKTSGPIAEPVLSRLTVDVAMALK